MKKIMLCLVLLSTIFVGNACFAQITLSNPSTINSGDELVIDVANEIVGGYIGSMPRTGYLNYTTPDGGGVIGNLLTSTRYFNPANPNYPSQFKYKFTNTFAYAVTVEVTFAEVIIANSTNASNYNTSLKTSVTINPEPYFYNSAISGSFVRNNCGTNAIPGPAVPYSVAANKYRAPTQAAADSQAQAELATSGQANANAVGTCTGIPYIAGSSSSFRGQAYQYSIANGSPGDTYLWSVEAKQAYIVSGQGTSSAQIFLNEIGGTLPTTVIIKAKVTSSLGVVKDLQFSVTAKRCTNCPIN